MHAACRRPSRSTAAMDARLCRRSRIVSARRRACCAARPRPGRGDGGQRRRRHECDPVRPGRHDDRRCVLARRRHADRVGRRPGATGCALQAGGNRTDSAKTVTPASFRLRWPRSSAAAGASSPSRHAGGADHHARRRSTASLISGMRSLPKYMSSPPTKIVGEPKPPSIHQLLRRRPQLVLDRLLLDAREERVGIDARPCGRSRSAPEPARCPGRHPNTPRTSRVRTARAFLLLLQHDAGAHRLHAVHRKHLVGRVVHAQAEIVGPSPSGPSCRTPASAAPAFRANCARWD